MFKAMKKYVPMLSGIVALFIMFVLIVRISLCGKDDEVEEDIRTAEVSDSESI